MEIWSQEPLKGVGESSTTTTKKKKNKSLDYERGLENKRQAFIYKKSIEPLSKFKPRWWEVLKINDKTEYRYL
jgi:hypothetical protein